MESTAKPQDLVAAGGQQPAESVMQKVLTLAVGCGTLLEVFAESPNCGYL
ncbi:MAG: hypothetical protein LJE87_08845 [Deltaproteobacteria bacterium]|nr:hypothetical protein [Deltaproteobacteria bacterium]